MEVLENKRVGEKSFFSRVPQEHLFLLDVWAASPRAVICVICEHSWLHLFTLPENKIDFSFLNVFIMSVQINIPARSIFMQPAFERELLQSSRGSCHFFAGGFLFSPFSVKSFCGTDGQTDSGACGYGEQWFMPPFCGEGSSAGGFVPLPPATWLRPVHPACERATINYPH